MKFFEINTDNKIDYKSEKRVVRLMIHTFNRNVVGVKIMSIEQYLKKIMPYLGDMISEWKIQYF